MVFVLWLKRKEKNKNKNRKALKVTENSLVIDLSHKSVVRTFHSYIVWKFLLFPSLQTISRLFFIAPWEAATWEISKMEHLEPWKILQTCEWICSWKFFWFFRCPSDCTRYASWEERSESYMYIMLTRSRSCVLCSVVQTLLVTFDLGNLRRFILPKLF